MARFLCIMLVAATVVLCGCRSNSGSREYIPNKGWVPTR